MAEAARNLSCVGAEPLAVTDNLNFGSPENAIGYWQLAEACRGLSEACTAFSTPVTGGNVSLYNETLDADGKPQPIYPTPVVGMVGLIPDLTKICGQGWQAEDDLIYLLGVPLDAEPSAIVTLGGSEYLAAIQGVIAGQPPVVDFALERRVQAVCREGIRQGWIRSAHDSAEGGIAIAIAESCISGNLGATLTFPDSSCRLDHLLFAEGGARIIVSVARSHQSQWEAYLQTHLDTAWQALGVVSSHADGLSITINHSAIRVEIDTLSDRWKGAIESYLAD